MSAPLSKLQRRQARLYPFLGALLLIGSCMIPGAHP